MGVYGTARALNSSAANPGVRGQRMWINRRNVRRYRAPTVQLPRTYDSMPVATTRVAVNDESRAETLTPVPSLDSLPYVRPLLPHPPRLLASFAVVPFFAIFPLTPLAGLFQDASGVE